MTDPYDIAASRLIPTKSEAIRAFWNVFAAEADNLDKAFNGDGDIDQSIYVMQNLQQVAPELMWEFGPSEKGHSLCVTAEWRPEIRALARAVINLAPSLERWAFQDARLPDQSGELGESFQARFRMPLTLTDIEVAPGDDNKIEMTGVGTGSEDELGNQTLAAAGFLLGEEMDWNWFGDVKTRPTKSSLLSRFTKSKGEDFKVRRFVDQFKSTIDSITKTLPENPYSIPDHDAEISLLKFENGCANRPDLFTFSVRSLAYAEAALQTTRFSSMNHSRFGEWFLFLRIPRAPEHPFDQIDDRFQIEETLQSVLADVGGVVAAGHGHESVYIDLALTDIDQGLRIVAEALGDRPFFDDTYVHFLEAGLPDTGFALSEFGAAVS